MIAYETAMPALSIISNRLTIGPVLGGGGQGDLGGNLEDGGNSPKWKGGCIWALVWGADENREVTVVVRRKSKAVPTAQGVGVGVGFPPKGQLEPWINDLRQSGGCELAITATQCLSPLHCYLNGEAGIRSDSFKANRH